MADDPAGKLNAEASSPSGPTLTANEVLHAYDEYLRKPPDAAPEWVPLAALRLWAAAPATVTQLRRLIQDGPMIERLALINAGLGRKGTVTAS
ncbi:MAG: hypothetical protein M3296_07950, partial [Actinomycetota bacterium]|nr:hypothetical protein [Actinomycetota bacterium]